MGEFIEYPKMLYKNGNTDEPYIIVVDAKEEQAARKDGFAFLGDTGVTEASKKPAMADGGDSGEDFDPEEID